jgi:hypothetical protein
MVQHEFVSRDQILALRQETTFDDLKKYILDHPDDDVGMSLGAWLAEGWIKAGGNIDDEVVMEMNLNKSIDLGTDYALIADILHDLKIDAESNDAREWKAGVQRSADETWRRYWSPRQEALHASGTGRRSRA